MEEERTVVLPQPVFSGTATNTPPKTDDEEGGD